MQHTASLLRPDWNTRLYQGRAFQSAALLRSDFSCRVRPDICGPSDRARHGDRRITACRVQPALQAVSGKGVWLLGTCSDEAQQHRWNHTESQAFIHSSQMSDGADLGSGSVFACVVQMGFSLPCLEIKRVCMMICKVKVINLEVPVRVGWKWFYSKSMYVLFYFYCFVIYYNKLLLFSFFTTKFNNLYF